MVKGANMWDLATIIRINEEAERKALAARQKIIDESIRLRDQEPPEPQPAPARQEVTQ